MDKIISERIKIKDGKIIKYGKDITFQEVENIKFIRNNTKIPVPHVYDYYTENDCNYIVMEYIEGDTLKNMLDNNLLTENDINDICLQLKEYIKELRNIKSNFIGSINKKSINDVLFDNIGPYDEITFNKYIINSINNILGNYYTRLIEKMMLNNHSIILSHGDLTPRNIIIRNKNIVGIIDWECAGYYPEYWEYVKSRIGVSWDNIWFSKIEEFLDSYYYEYSVFNMILKAYF